MVRPVAPMCSPCWNLPRGGNDYGVRIRGYLLPPVDGDYRFWIAADDRGALFLSTDETPDERS
ncbi:MAG: hypothetical protein IPK16_06205 [Anaerolineales bacterium]|nr:hypothetical protein [Anaerolineales bacterium]